MIPLPQERQLVVRPVEPSDVDGLVALYGGLDPDDHRRRFFCSYRPPPTWFVELADPEARRGARLVAVVETASTSTLVAEAGYAGLPNGNGDLELVVARPWRGWLGPYLLAELCTVAASRGVPNLEADVLTTNGPMLALLRRRGAVVMEHDGWSTLRLRIGTSGATPTWHGFEPGRRVLVESPGARWAGEDAARQAGLAVLMCSGPGPQRSCPRLTGGRCVLADDADAIVVRHPPGDESWDALIAEHRRLDPALALILEELGGASGPTTPDEVARHLG